MHELIFDKENHLYYWEGRLVPSVTEILKKSGIIDDRFFKPGSAEKGTRIHELCEQIAKREEPDEENGYTKAFRKFLEDTKIEPAEVETSYYSELDFAGTMDIIALFRGELVIIDIKTGAYQEWWPLQLAGYSMLIGNNDIRRFSLEIKNTEKYKFTEYKNREEDAAGFMSALETYNQLYRGGFIADFC
ncbi:MAG: hypothetical protein EVJ48_02820 [Candidatus Acidulodesulfobacterium acidiphilum]|uniref:PD-(D/E)XK endonuclease-like domain-containing protein n=1 Tax=Candidatus Acidulodesulfobacterium acidiphilum TaxID=2597224 RepID=A0A520XFB0_9DELT|nr:MAG: hypothetical protein EVJ48_02820 [Candidatus Acidulodesulfobacterium acidiphilum]